MTWLLAQIGLSLLLAALAGWFVGWYLRAFRDQDRVEDLRQTMLATKDVKDRELSELRRQVDDLETRLARASEASARTVAAAGSMSPGTVEISRVADHLRQPDSAAPAAALVEVPPPGAISEDDDAPAAELAGVAAAERERRREADAALRRRTAAMLTMQAEIEALREAVGEKAARIAQLRDRLAGAEPADRELESTHGEVASLQARLSALDEERKAVIATSAARDAELLEARKKIVIRDTRINDLRNRCAALETELAAARGAAVHGGDQDVEQLKRQLEDARRALQRQIDRNRKQEVVHRAVVEQLEGDKARLRAAAPAPMASPTPDSPQHVARRGLPPKRSDELTQISGVGPAFARAMREAGIDTHAQIAAWTESDIKRYASLLRTHAKRIRTDRWVEQARVLAQTSRARRD